MHGETNDTVKVEGERSRNSADMPARGRYQPPRIEKGRRLSDVSGAQASGAPAPVVS